MPSINFCSKNSSIFAANRAKGQQGQALCPARACINVVLLGICTEFRGKFVKIARNFDKYNGASATDVPYTYASLYDDSKKKMSPKSHTREFFNSKKTYLATFLWLP